MSVIDTLSTDAAAMPADSGDAGSSGRGTIRDHAPRTLPGDVVSRMALPARVLPHQLAHKPDLPRQAMHESALDEPVSPRLSAEDAIDYGLWWHETLEFAPWTGGTALAAHASRRLETARAAGFGARAEDEWSRLLASDEWKEMTSPCWTRLAELAVFAPLADGVWMDGVIDLVMHDAESRRVWVVDWKTNRRRPGEGDDALLERLRSEYEPQLRAYGKSVRSFFPDCEVRLLVYSTAAARWTEVTRGAN